MIITWIFKLIVCHCVNLLWIYLSSVYTCWATLRAHMASANRLQCTTALGVFSMFLKAFSRPLAKLFHCIACTCSHDSRERPRFRLPLPRYIKICFVECSGFFLARCFNIQSHFRSAISTMVSSFIVKRFTRNFVWPVKTHCI